MNYPLPVVAEKGRLQRLLGLDPIDRTTTTNFPHGKVVLRTHVLPSKDQPMGNVGVYYTDDDGYRAMFELRPMYSWNQNGRTCTDEAYYVFKTGCVKESSLDALMQTIKMIKTKLDESRKPRTDEEED